MAEDLNDGVARVRLALEQGGFPVRIVELQASARSAVEAAAAVGCEVAQIAKSIVFRGESTGEPVLVVTSGANRVHEPTLASLLGEAPGKADANYVRSQTGFVIGGVAPLAHARPLRVLIDRDLLAFDAVWAAAGHPRVVFRLDPRDLPRMTGGGFAAVTAD